MLEEMICHECPNCGYTMDIVSISDDYFVEYECIHCDTTDSVQF